MIRKNSVVICGVIMLTGVILFSGCKKKTPTTPDPTATPVPTATSVPTATPVSKLTGTITYTGALGPVDATHWLSIAMWDNVSLNDPMTAFDDLTSSGATYTMLAPATGNYYVSIFFDVSAASSPGDVDIHVGDPFFLYNSGCTPPADPIAISGTTNLSFSFGDACRYYGVFGSINYTGALGPVTANNRLYVGVYEEVGLITEYIIKKVVPRPNNGDRYDFIDFGGAPGGQYYFRAFFDFDGNASSGCGSPPCIGTGDPYIVITPPVTSTAAMQNISFGDSFIY